MAQAAVNRARLIPALQVRVWAVGCACRVRSLFCWNVGCVMVQACRAAYATSVPTLLRACMKVWIAHHARLCSPF